MEVTYIDHNLEKRIICKIFTAKEERKTSLSKKLEIKVNNLKFKSNRLLKNWNETMHYLWTSPSAKCGL